MLHVWLLVIAVIQLQRQIYCDSDLVDISDLLFQSYQIAVITLSVIGETIG